MSYRVAIRGNGGDVNLVFALQPPTYWTSIGQFNPIPPTTGYLNDNLQPFYLDL